MISSPPTSEQCVSAQSSPPREFWGLWCETHHRPSSECREIEKDALLAASCERVRVLEAILPRNERDLARAVDDACDRAETAEASLKEAVGLLNGWNRYGIGPNHFETRAFLLRQKKEVP